MLTGPSRRDQVKLHHGVPFGLRELVGFRIPEGMPETTRSDSCGVLLQDLVCTQKCLVIKDDYYVYCYALVFKCLLLLIDDLLKFKSTLCLLKDIWPWPSNFLEDAKE